MVALGNLKAAGVDHKVIILIGPAAESLPKLNPEEPYDLVFIDADKPSEMTREERRCHCACLSQALFTRMW